MIPLTIRSSFSLMWGVNSPERICARACELGYTHLALTDRDNLYGLWEFIKACKRHSLTPLTGAEVSETEGPERAVCLVENREGYSNLCRILTRRHCDKAFKLAETIATYSAGLVVLSSSPVMLEQLTNHGVNTAAALGGRPDQQSDTARRAAIRLGIPAVVTADACFLHAQDYELHRMLRAIAMNTSLSRLKPSDLASPDAWLASPSEYRKRFEVWPGVVDAAIKLGERLTFHGPEFGLVMPQWLGLDEEQAAAVLAKKACTGAEWRYGTPLPEAVRARMAYELDMIGRMRFTAYFLVVQDIVKRSPRICGRGSGAASIVAYCLGITNVCPIKYNLYFERFLNPGRKDPPDIDVDFAWDERDELIGSVLEQYRKHSAMVCNHVLFQPRMAIREVAKVYGLTDREIGQVSKRLPWIWRVAEVEGALLERLRKLPQLRELDFPQPWPEIINTAQKLIGIPRNLSVHPGGVVITPEPIDGYAPLEIATKGVPVIQWEKDGTEDSGLVKIDLLGNRSLAVIRDAIANVKENGGDFNERFWNPEDDAATQVMIAAGDTMGCFYIESPATRLLQRKARVGDYEHMVIHTSIIRPAANRYINEYLRRLHGGAWQPIHPLLGGVLDDTYGIMVYQEDMARAAVAVAGFTDVEADRLRKIMSKKDRELHLRDYRDKFAAGARERGVSDAQIDEIWEMIKSFEGYSFCKPHSASYIRVSFQAAWLKCHYPAEFMAAVISNMGGFYSTFAYVSEARRLGVCILPPDVNRSLDCWRGSRGEIRVGLMSIAELGADIRARILAEQGKGSFTSFGDFIRRVAPSEDEARSLIYARAFESLCPESDPAELLWELACRRRNGTRSTRSADLFDKGANLGPPSVAHTAPMDRLRREYSALGFLCDLHPMKLFEEPLTKRRIVKAVEMARFSGKRVRMAGLLLTGKIVSTKHGDPMEFITFEDESGLIETTFFPKAYERFCAILDRSQPFILSGLVDEHYGAHTLTVDRVERMPG